MRTFASALLFFALLSYAQADNFEEGLEVQCDQYQMRVRDFDFTNNEPGQCQNVGTVIYRDKDRHKVSCVLNKHKGTEV